MESTTVQAISTAMGTGTSILTNGWTFIQTNPILFGVCTLGIVTAGIKIVKKIMRG